MSEFQYSISQLSFSENQKKRIDVVLAFLKAQENYLNKDGFFINFQENLLDECSLDQLIKLSNLKHTLFELEDIHFKTLRSIEYRNIEVLLKCIEPRLKEADEIILHLHEYIKNQFTIVSKDNQVFASLFSFNDFKKILHFLFDKKNISLSQLRKYKKDNFFEYVRQQILSTSIILEDKINNKNTISLEELKPYGKLYNFIAAEFFFQYCRHFLTSEVEFSGQFVHHEFVRPSHKLAPELNLSNAESAILSLSLNPFSPCQLYESTQISYFDLLFEVASEVENYQCDIFWSLNLNNQVFNLKVPVYYSYIKLQLIASQRTNK